MPLAGRHILVTRAHSQAGRLSAELVKFGADVIEIPTIDVVPPESWEHLDAALRNLHAYEWLIVTSANAVRFLEKRCATLGIPLQEVAALKIAAVGAKTARAVEDAGLSVTITPKEYVAESLVDELKDQAAHARILIVRATVARDVIPDALTAWGARVTIAEAYRTVVPSESVEKIAAIFAAAPPDAATFTSSSTVTNFFQLLRQAGCERSAQMRAISIGPITSRTLREHGWEPSAEAEPHDIDGLIRATVHVLC